MAIDKAFWVIWSDISKDDGDMFDSEADAILAAKAKFRDESIDWYVCKATRRVGQNEPTVNVFTLK
jgi:hypothetical protein